jgi:lipopolysaccharide assembly outer membrane protein LptD (OstA)
VVAAACLMAAGLAAAPASAQAVPGCRASKQFTIEQVGKDHWKLTGAVEIDCDSYKLYADEVEVFTDRHQIVATGNVLYTEGSARISGDRAVFDTEQRTGTFFNAAGSASLGDRVNRDVFGGQEPDMYFFGEELSKIGPDRYRITHGRFTTCLQPTPRWELVTGSAVLRLDHYAMLKNTVLRVKRVPVFYFPLAYYPIKKEDRATGFLMPSYGSSTIRGFSLSGAFFWAISRSQDATFMVDWYSRTGFGYGAEYRYAASPSSSGDLRVYQLNEHASTYTTAGGGSAATTVPARRSFQVRGSVAQALPLRLRLRGNVDYFSDLTVQQTYHQDIYAASLRQRGYGLNISGNWGRLSASGIVGQNETFLGISDSYVTGSRPRLTVSRSAQRIGGLPLVFSIGGEVARIVRGNRTVDSPFVDEGLTRVDVMPQLRVPITRWQFLPVDAWAAFRDTWYSESLRDGVRVPEPVNRHYFRFGGSITGPILTRIWNTPKNGYAEKFKHVIEPSFSFERYTTVSNDAQIIKFEGVDFIVGGTTSATYGVTTRLLAKRREGAAGTSTREFLSASLFQTYYTDARASQYDYAYSTSFTARPPSNWSPISMSVRVSPSDRFNAQVRLEYDAAIRALQSVSVIGGVSSGSWLHVNGGWSQRRFTTQTLVLSDDFVNAGATLRTPSNRVGGTYTFHYDLGRRTLLQNRVVGYFNAQCCGFAVEYQTFNFPTGDPRFPVSRDRRFNFSITLAGLGTFSNLFGAFGGAAR